MLPINRTIEVAIDNLTGKRVTASELFDNGYTESFTIRKKFQEKTLSWSCVECGQELNLSHTGKERLYFKHGILHNYCPLTDGNMHVRDLEKFSNIIAGKESERHKELKHKIGNLLKQVNGVDTLSISIDSKFVIRNGEKRRPDVYCKYLGRELVFEIQLSELPLGYILNRYNFYRKNGMYLIWILDNFDLNNQGVLEKDIKYLAGHQNFFKLDEEAKSFKLLCDYKSVYVTKRDEVHSKWSRASVSLNEVSFDESIYQIYYYDFAEHKKNKQIELEKLISDKKLLAEEQAAVRKLNQATSNVTRIFNTITEKKNKNSLDYYGLTSEVSQLNELEITLLNEKLGLTTRHKNGIPVVHDWIRNSNQSYDYFLQFLFVSENIHIDFSSKTADNTTLFQEILLNNTLYSHYLIKPILKRGYELNDEDCSLYEKLYGDEQDMLLLYRICSQLKDKSLVAYVFAHDKLLYTIESAACKKIVGYRLANWVALANNAIDHHKEYWEFIELAFKKYGIWDLIIASDRKGNFRKKLENFNRTRPEQKTDYIDLLRNRYPELEYL